MEITQASEQQFELRDYFGVLRRRWRSVVIVTALVLGIALAYSLTRTPIYQASTDVLLKRNTALEASGGVAASTQGLETEIAVLTSRSVRDAVTEEIGHAPSVSAKVLGATEVVQISASSTDAEQAISDANAYAAVSIELRRQSSVDDYLEAAQVIQTKLDEIDARIASEPNLDERVRLNAQKDFYANELDKIRFAAGASGEIGGAQVLSKAVFAEKTRPAPLRDGLVGLIGGLMLAIALAFTRDYLDDSIRSKADLERAAGGLTVVGIIPAVPGWKEKSGPRLISLANPQSIYTESYVSLRTSLQFLALDRPLKIIQITSASAGEGKTTTIANLGVVLARAGQRVVIVSCDLRVPRIHMFFDQSNEVGFTSVLLGQCPLSAAIQPVAGQPGLVVLPSGPPPPNPAELLSTPRASEVLQSIASNCDIVLVDSPPTLPVADARVLSRAVDATLVVARAGKTSRRSLGRAIEVLREVGAPLVGTVLNGLQQRHGDTYSISYGYGYGSYVEAPTETPTETPTPAPTATDAPSGNGIGDDTDPGVPKVAAPTTKG